MSVQSSPIKLNRIDRIETTMTDKIKQQADELHAQLTEIFNDGKNIKIERLHDSRINNPRGYPFYAYISWHNVPIGDINLSAHDGSLYINYSNNYSHDLGMLSKDVLADLVNHTKYAFNELENDCGVLFLVSLLDPKTGEPIYVASDDINNYSLVDDKKRAFGCDSDDCSEALNYLFKNYDHERVARELRITLLKKPSNYDIDADWLKEHYKMLCSTEELDSY